MPTPFLRRLLWSLTLPALAGCSVDEIVSALAEPEPFRIDVQYLTTPPAAVAQALAMATARWQTVLTVGAGDRDVVLPAGTCDPLQRAVTIPEGHLVLYVTIRPIDGRDNTLAEAAPCFVMESTGLPLAGVIELDAADIAGALADGTLDDIARHEIGHVLGFGTLWTDQGLLGGSVTTQLYFAGASARSLFAASGGTAFLGVPVPVEMNGGEGTAGGHWRSTVFGPELMIGEVDYRYQMPLSRVTVASFADLGYEVDVNAADPFVIGAAASMTPTATKPARDIAERPLYVLRNDGTLTRRRTRP